MLFGGKSGQQAGLTLGCCRMSMPLLKQQLLSREERLLQPSALLLSSPPVPRSLLCGIWLFLPCLKQFNTGMKEKLTWNTLLHRALCPNWS